MTAASAPPKKGRAKRTSLASLRGLPGTLLAFLVVTLSVFQQGIDHDLASARNFGRYDLVELCAPKDSSLSGEGQRRGLLCQRFGLHNKCDLSKTNGYDMAGEG